MRLKCLGQCLTFGSVSWTLAIVMAAIALCSLGQERGGPGQVQPSRRETGVAFMMCFQRATRLRFAQSAPKA